MDRDSLLYFLQIHTEILKNNCTHIHSDTLLKGFFNIFYLKIVMLFFTFAQGRTDRQTRHANYTVASLLEINLPSSNHAIE